MTCVQRERRCDGESIIRSIDLNNRMDVTVDRSAAVESQVRQYVGALFSGDPAQTRQDVDPRTSGANNHGRFQRLLAKRFSPAQAQEIVRRPLEATIVKTRPEGMPVGVDWPEEIYTSSETPWSVSIDGSKFPISELDLELVDPTLLGPIRFALANDQARAELELEIYPVGETSDFRFKPLGDKPVYTLRAETAIPARRSSPRTRRVCDLPTAHRSTAMNIRR